VELKIAKDGEILAKGPNVMSGYYKNDQETKSVIDGEGWFHTGDIGKFDDQGFLKITDRKKDLIVSANGKNIAPAAVENSLKLDPYIIEAAVYGDKKSFLTAIIVPDFEKLASILKEKNITADSEEELVKTEAAKLFMLVRVNQAQGSLAS